MESSNFKKIEHSIQSSPIIGLENFIFVTTSENGKTLDVKRQVISIEENIATSQSKATLKQPSQSSE